MRLLSLDFDPVYGADTTRSNFEGDLSVFDYDVVIWDPAGSLGNYVNAYTESYQGLPCLSDDASVRMQSDVKRRQSEFTDFVNAGRCLVAIATPPQKCYIATGSKDYSGTGRNRLTTRHVTPLDLLSALPTSGPTFTLASGDRIDFDGDGSMVSLLRRYKKFLSYEAVISGFAGTVLAHVTGTDRTVSGMQRSKNAGHFIILPTLNFEADLGKDKDDELDEEDEKRWVKEAPEFQAELLSAIEQLGGSVASRPAWADNFATAEQLTIGEELSKQLARVEAARTKLSTLQRQKEEAESKDQLYLGTGRSLELEVKSVLELLGGTVTEPAPGRDDWRVEFPEGKAVVEVKCLTKSAAEKHAAQLEKWVAGTLEETGESFKGLLVANTFRETQLDRRTGKNFPDQMIPYSQSRGHCLITGLQLFVIRSEVEKDPTAASQWRKKLIETSGLLPGADKWQAVIQKSPAEKPEES
jgi:hypothetical protein